MDIAMVGLVAALTACMLGLLAWAGKHVSEGREEH